MTTIKQRIKATRSSRTTRETTGQ